MLKEDSGGVHPLDHTDVKGFGMKGTFTGGDDEGLVVASGLAKDDFHVWFGFYGLVECLNFVERSVGAFDVFLAEAFFQEVFGGDSVYGDVFGCGLVWAFVELVGYYFCNVLDVLVFDVVG